MHERRCDKDLKKRCLNKISALHHAMEAKRAYQLRLQVRDAEL